MLINPIIRLETSFGSFLNFILNFTKGDLRNVVLGGGAGQK